MLKKIIAIVSLAALLNLGFITPTDAGYLDSTAVSALQANFDLVDSTIWADGLQVKRGEPYDEKKDPALRKGTENEEMPQGSFFAIPGLLVGIVGILLWFNRDKE